MDIVDLYICRGDAFISVLREKFFLIDQREQ